MNPNTEQIRAALAEVTDPRTELPLEIADDGLQVADTGNGTALSITVTLGYPNHNGQALLRKRIETALGPLRVTLKDLTCRVAIAAHVVQKTLYRLPGVRNIVAIASGKGGVGKSTVAVNVALALMAEGASVGLLDADIYGPSVPIMLGLSGRPKSLDGKTMLPMNGHGLQANSIGFLIDNDAPAIWRGPMVTQALVQLLNLTSWNDLDYLIVDMPPGTGDIALTMAQKVPLTGAVIVTTPQDLALADARKGLVMFQKVDVPVLGVVENMSVHICSNCGHVEPIFGEGGGRNLAEEFRLPWLGGLPLVMSIRTQTDSGNPTVVAEPDGEIAAMFHEVANKLAVGVARLPLDHAGKKPSVVARAK